MLLRMTIAVVVCLALTMTTKAELRVAGVFGDGMVLQRDMPAPVWGWAEPGDRITVHFKAQTQTAVTGEDGTWRVTFEPLEADAKPAALTIRSSNAESVVRDLELVNVLVGEVWLCAGQSNMFLQVKQTLDSAKEIEAADYPQIRHIFGCPWNASEPQADYQANWQVCSPDTVGDFSGVPYYFARELHQTLDVPVGVIVIAYGPSLIQSYISKESFQTIDFGRQSLAYWDKKVADAPPEEREKVHNSPLHPAAFFNGSIHPLAGMALRGFAWYQGESDSDHGIQQHYHEQMPLLIEDWRHHWGRNDMPFLMVQLPQIGSPRQTSWAHLREGTLHALRTVPHTGMAVTIDTGDPRDVHPPNKQEPGRRLALAALGVAYGRDLVYSGPIYNAAEFLEDRVRITFDHVGGGLTVKGDALAGFEVAGADGRFVQAEARIEGDAVIVHAPDDMKPEAVRYAWANNPPCTLYNKQGLPASPFRAQRVQTPE